MNIFFQRPKQIKIDEARVNDISKSKINRIAVHSLYCKMLHSRSFRHTIVLITKIIDRNLCFYDGSFVTVRAKIFEFRGKGLHFDHIFENESEANINKKS